ncbi:hypothetical protein FRC12_016504 [Ceratobasidium sp. 428]|nr:hypothetical protein FRC12_016504 [Ceratobasidium sp. 428]
MLPSARPAHFEAFVVVFPLSLYAEDYGDIPGDQMIPNARVRFPDDKIQSCLQRFKSLGLVADISIPADLPPEQFYNHFTDSLQTHLHSNSWRLPDPGSNGTEFERKPYRMLVRANRSGSVYLARPKDTLVLSEFTARRLSRKPYKGVPNTIDGNPSKIVLFLCGNVRGSINRFPGCEQAAPGLHVCAPFRAYDGWVVGNFDIVVASDDVHCFPDCPGSEADEAERVAMAPTNDSSSDESLPSTRQLVARLRPTARSSARRTRPATQVVISRPVIEIPSDNEEADYESAVRASLQTYQNESRVGESSRTGSAMQISNVGNSSTTLNQVRPHVLHKPCNKRPIYQYIKVQPSEPASASNTGSSEGHQQPHRAPVLSYVPESNEIRDLFGEIETRLPARAGPRDHLVFRLREGTEEDAAYLFLGFLQNYVARLYNLEEPPIDVDQNWRTAITPPQSLTGLLYGRHSWNLGSGHGDGVGRGIVEACMTLIFSNEEHYEENHYTGNSIPLRPLVYEQGNRDASRQLQFATHGFFAAVYMFWRQAGPPRLSGIFIQAIVGGWNSICDDRLLRLLCPEFAEMYLPLSQLPLDSRISAQPSLVQFLQPALDGQSVHSLDRRNRARPRPLHEHICAIAASFYLLSTSRQESFEHHQDVSSFRQGFNIPIVDGDTLISLLRPASTTIFPNMWCRAVSSADVFLEHLRICPEPDYTTVDPMPMRAEHHIIASALRRYFSQPGHPDCPMIRALVPAEAIESMRNDHTIRSRLFIFTSTASWAAPTEPGWRVTIELAREAGTRPDAGGPRPISIHVCARSVTLTYDDDLINACLEPIPPNNPNFSRLFDRWFHSQICGDGPDTFSIL